MKLRQWILPLKQHKVERFISSGSVKENIKLTSSFIIIEKTFRELNNQFLTFFLSSYKNETLNKKNNSTTMIWPPLTNFTLKMRSILKFNMTSILKKNSFALLNPGWQFFINSDDIDHKSHESIGNKEPKSFFYLFLGFTPFRL